MSFLTGEQKRKESLNIMPTRKKKRQLIRRVDPYKARTSTAVGGHGLLSVVKPRVKPNRITNVKKHFAPRKR